MVHRFLAAFALLAALAACKTPTNVGPIVSGSKHDIAAVELSLPATGPERVAVAVLDQRPGVPNGKTSEEFIGTERAPWSQTVNIKTASGRGFAADLADVVVNALTRAGADASALELPRGAGDAEAKAAAQAAGADRLLAIRIGEWRSDSYTRVMMKWRFDATVYDAAGTVLGRSRTSGNTPVGDTTADEKGERITQRELAHQLGNLLVEPAITGALR